MIGISICSFGDDVFTDGVLMEAMMTGRVTPPALLSAFTNEERATIVHRVKALISKS